MGKHAVPMKDPIDRWFQTRMCCCGDKLKDHDRHFTGSACSKCPCERFQWRFTKWIY